MKIRGFTLLEVLIALAMFVLAVGGLSVALDRIFSANIVLRRDTEVRQQIESLVDEAMTLPIEVLEQGRETEPDAMGAKYTTRAELADLANAKDEKLERVWWVTVRGEWMEGREKQHWEEKFLRYQP
jgi:prepilin-type N-terminal cleavage/methylation domain-containing protein